MAGSFCLLKYGFIFIKAGHLKSVPPDENQYQLFRLIYTGVFRNGQQFLQ